MLKAFGRLAYRPAELWMLGQGPLEESLRAEADKIGLGRRVRWLGHQENPFPFFREADCFALSSLREGLPNVLIEAMACGTPVVSTNCPYGPEELIRDGENGLLVPVGDEKSLAAALGRLAEETPLRQRMGRAARTFVSERFQLPEILSRYEELFFDLAHNRSAL